MKTNLEIKQMKIKIKDNVKIIQWNGTKECLSKIRRALPKCSIKKMGTNIKIIYLDNPQIELGLSYYLFIVAEYKKIFYITQNSFNYIFEEVDENEKN